MIRGHHIGVIASSRQVDDELWTNLISWWKLTETGGGTSEDSHGSDDGVVSGATQTSSGLDCDNDSDYTLVSPDAYGENDFTIIMRIYAAGTSTGVDHRLLGYNGDNFQLVLNGQGTNQHGLYARKENAAISGITSSLVVNGNAWNMIAVVRIGDTVRFFCNGSFESETFPSSPDFSNRWNRLGAAGTTDNPSSGAGTTLDSDSIFRDVCHFSDAKSDAYITAFYNSGSYTDYEDGDPI